MFYRILFTSFVVLIVCSMPIVSRAVVIYSEDWEGGTDGQSILDPPFSYIAQAGAATFAINSSTPFGPGLAVNGAWDGTFSAAATEITPPTLAAGSKYVLTASVNFHSAMGSPTSSSWIGLSMRPEGGTGNFNASGAYIGVESNPASPTWYFDLRGVRGFDDANQFLLGSGLGNSIVSAKIELDIDTNSATATVTDGTTTLTQTVSGGMDFSGIHRFAIQERTALGLDVDNVLIEETLTSTTVPGDFDADGDVDGADFVAWQTHFPTASGATLADGDADADGDVDGADFVVWQTNFPFTPGPGVSPVPEPQAILLAAVGMVSVVLARYRRSHRCEA